MFIDRAKITIIAGNGGNGIISFRREKYVPKGGPDGGDGGNGGNVIFMTDSNLQTLLDFRYKRIFKSESGKHGQGANKIGRSGKDCIIRVPLGSVIKDSDTGEILADLVEENQQVIAAKGGRGGKGNARFATPTNRTPRYSEPGTEGETREIKIELKLIADVGLVGLPNAGKSTLLSRLSAAHPKIADYPFTTLKPNLGIVKVSEYSSFVMADIPGLIEGAHDGKGLGLEFLRHIERTKVLAFLIESIDDDIIQTFKVLQNELKLYNPELVKRPSVLVITKFDLMINDETINYEKIRKLKLPFINISSVSGEGLGELKNKLCELLDKTKKS